MRRDQAYLQDILKLARDAVKIGRNLSLEEFKSNRELQLAVLKALEAIGESAAKISPAVRAEYPETPWRERLFGIQHRLVRGYFEVDFEQVWQTVRNDLPVLVSAIEPFVISEEE
ncbi:MAG: DUF86 domain-containing protein [Anaerolineales bacterium]|jgi:uncharacterized protein with HEPN domain|nr:DUF86 domain-containing protein [Anaerolineales bacterium]